MARSTTTIFGTLFLFVVIAAAVNWHLKKSKTPQKPKGAVLIVGTNAEFPPFEFIQDGKLTGFDIDLVEEIAKRLGKDIEIKDMPFTSLLTQLQLGTLDVLAAGLTPTPARAEYAKFTQNYLEGNPVLIVSHNTTPIRSLSELEGKQVLINDGFTSENYVTSIPNIQIRRLPTLADAIMALGNKRADAFITSESSMKEYLKQYPNHPYVLTAIPNTSEPSALALNKTQDALYDEINNVLTVLLSDGTIAELRKKWGL